MASALIFCADPQVASDRPAKPATVLPALLGEVRFLQSMVMASLDHGCEAGSRHWHRRPVPGRRDLRRRHRYEGDVRAACRGAATVISSAASRCASFPPGCRLQTCRVLLPHEAMAADDLVPAPFCLVMVGGGRTGAKW